MPKKSETAQEATAGEPSTATTPPPEVPTPPPEVSAAASALGKRARGVPKTLTPERREELREAAAHARGFRRVSGQVAPAQGRRVRGVPVPVAPAPVAPAVGRRVSAKIVVPTQSDVDAFGRGR